MSFPFYTVRRGPRTGTVLQFTRVSEQEYIALGDADAKRLERKRIQSARIKADPAAQARITARQRERRKDPVVRAVSRARATAYRKRAGNQKRQQRRAELRRMKANQSADSRIRQ